MFRSHPLKDCLLLIQNFEVRVNERIQYLQHHHFIIPEHEASFKKAIEHLEEMFKHAREADFALRGTKYLENTHLPNKTKRFDLEKFEL